MAAPVRSDSFSSSRGSELRLPLAIRHGRSRSFTIGTSSFPEPEPHHESHRESLSKGRYPGEPPRRSYYSFTLKNVVAGLLLVCFAAFLLVHDVRSAPLVLRMFQEDQSSDDYHNASDDPTPGEVLGDIDLSVEENAAVEEGFGGDSNSAVAEESAPEEAMIVDMDADVPIAGWDIPRAIPKTWKPPKRCATVEEMGWETTGDTRAASLRVRAMIQDWMAVHGAKRVSQLVASDFCQQGFVLGMPLEDGFGNNMYKVLTAAGVALMLNRSLIIAEHGALNWGYSRRDPGKKRAFEEYLEFSEEAFTMREVRRLWAVNKCKRALVIHNDSLEKGFRRTSCICDDWTALTAPILHFRGAIGSGAIQLLLKNKHLAMRRAAVQLLGHPGIPSSRPNTFGELFRAFIAPNADIRDAVQWALKGGPDPDITLHLRMLHSRTKPAPQAASSCITRIRRNHPTRGRPRVVVVTDTPAITRKLKKALGDSTEVVQFDYRAYAKQMTNRSEVLSLSYGVPKNRMRQRDWGEMPRWVAMVDFFLAARARSAVISGAYRRVSTTYAQLVAAFANANTLESQTIPCVYYSSLQSSLVAFGLKSQSGWGHSWRPFGGKLGCRHQPPQCARTALLPYTWWDAPWQSPIGADVIKLKGVAGINSDGQVNERRMDQFCAAARRLSSTKLQIPSYEDAIA